MQRLIPDIPEDEVTDAVRKGMAIHWLSHAHHNLIAARNQLVIQRDGIRALKKLQDKR